VHSIEVTGTGGALPQKDYAFRPRSIFARGG